MIGIPRLWRIYDRLCFYCEEITWCGRGKLGMEDVVRELCRHPDSLEVQRRRATREHLLRKADGGSNYRDNIVLSCAGCNHSRGNRTPEEHQLIIRRAKAQRRRSMEGEPA